MRRTAAIVFTLGLAMMFAAAIGGCRRYAPPIPLDQLNPQQARGHAVFEMRCAQCHSDRTDQPRNGPALAAIFKKPSLHSGAAATDERVTSTVLHGHGIMPAMGNQVDDQDMQDLLAYLHTL